jgi:hypothetical protein
MRPACPSRASSWSSLTTPWGFPCCVRFPCVRAATTAPVQQMGVSFALNHPSVSAFPERVVGSACTSSFSRFARRSLALRPAHSHCHQICDQLSEGFRHFVSSMPAPVASGWSGCRVGLAPTGEAPPCHGAHPMRTIKEQAKPWSGFIKLKTSSRNPDPPCALIATKALVKLA